MKFWKFLYFITSLTVQAEVQSKDVCLDFVATKEIKNKIQYIDSQFCQKMPMKGAQAKCEIIEFDKDGIVSSSKKASCLNFFNIWRYIQ